MELEFIEARDLPDAWFQSVYRLLATGREYMIDRGSFEGQKRLEFDFVTIHIKYPGARPLLPDIPPALGIPNPVADGYLEEYLPYLMTSARQPGEDYTYGQYLEPQIEGLTPTHSTRPPNVRLEVCPTGLDQERANCRAETIAIHLAGSAEDLDGQLGPTDRIHP